MIKQYKQFNKINNCMLKNIVKYRDEILNNDLEETPADVDFNDLKEFFKSNSAKTKTKKKNLQNSLFDGLDPDWDIKDFKEESLVNDKSINYDFSYKIEKQNRR